MINYIQFAEDGAIAQEIGHRNDIVWDGTHQCPAHALTLEEAALFRVHPVVWQNAPSIDWVTQRVEADGYAEVNGEWVNKWRVLDLDADTVATNNATVLAEKHASQVCTMRQARLALLGAGLLTPVNAALLAMTGIEGEAARIEWEYATEVRRDSALVAGLTAAIGLTDSQLDTLFSSAATL